MTQTDTTDGPRTISYADLDRLLSLMSGDEKHDPSALSTLDVLWVLHTRVLRRRGEDPDHFLLSKGHGPQAFYAVLAALGEVSEEELTTFGQFDSHLGYHPDRQLVAGVEISSGSLGHGLALASGLALGLRTQGLHGRVACLLGDAEMDEGSNHEALVVASRLKLDRLLAVVVDNQSASHGWPGGIEQRFAVEGWVTARVDGHDHDGLEAALRRTEPDRPSLVVAEVETK